MDPLGWIKTNLILILLVALGATFLFGSLGTLWYKNKAEKADLRAQVAEASLQTCATVNKGFADSVGRQNAGIDDLRKLCGDTKESADRAEKAAVRAAAAAAPVKTFATTLHNFKPPENTAAEPCRAERAVIDQFFIGKLKLSKGLGATP